ncbi:MAG: hypothetical protein ACT4PE_06245 [Candidatus Eiseniibacteriota bacterium]
MYRTRIAALALSTLMAAGTVPAQPTEPTPATAREVTSAEVDEAAARPLPLYGPIQAKDPLVRAEIKRLYLERGRVAADTQTKVAELGARMAAERDPDFRFEMSREIGQLKRHAERRGMEIGLEIARLNGDAERVAEFEAALDQLLNPDRYLPAPVDPSLQAERIRRLSTDVEVGR